MDNNYDVLIIGGGQAGLAAGYHLGKAGLRFAILEGGAEATGSWSRYYDSLKLFSPARYSSLPGMQFPGNPNRYPARDEVLYYLRAYVKKFNLLIITHAYVENVEHYGNGFAVRTKDGREFTARSVIAATGSFSRPHIPQFEGQSEFSGTVLHSSAYRNPEAFVNKRVLVVGAGNSAVQISTELAKHAQVTLTSRDPVAFRKQRILGFDIHFWMWITGYDTRKQAFKSWNPANIHKKEVLDTGIYQAAFASGNPVYHPLMTHFTAQGIEWADGTQAMFDAVIFATGFRPNLTFLEGLKAVDEYGNPLHEDGISTSVPGLYYMGLSLQRSEASATLRGVGDDSAYVANHLRQYLKTQQQPATQACCFNLSVSFGS